MNQDANPPTLNPFAFVMVDVEPDDGAVRTYEVKLSGLAGNKDGAGLNSFRDHSGTLLPDLSAMSPANPTGGPLLRQLYETAWDTARDRVARCISFTDGWGAQTTIRVVYMEPVV